MIEVGRTFGSHHPGITRQLTLPVEPPPGGPLATWPREAVLEWRARQRLAGADREGAAAALGELRDAGFAPLATRLAAEQAMGAAPGDPLAAARASLARGDVAAAAEAARARLASARGVERLEPLLLLGVAEFGAAHTAPALAAFGEAQRLAPGDGRAYTFEARVRLANGDAQGARRALGRGLAAAPADSMLQRAWRAMAGDAPPR
jgi:Flp pilus assembly protein TadD